MLDIDTRPPRVGPQKDWPMPVVLLVIAAMLLVALFTIWNLSVFMQTAQKDR